MAVMSSTATFATLILARGGRGFARLLEGLWNGDPVTWGIVGVVIAIMVGIAVFKRAAGASDDE